MSEILSKYRSDISVVFGIGVEVLNGARSLKGISLDLKLLAINGIVQAAKIGTSQGQSLITLSGFLSDLPIQIAPELDELERLTSRLSYQLTVCAIAVRRFYNYSLALSKIVDLNLEKLSSAYNANDFNLLDIRQLQKLHLEAAFNKLNNIDKDAIKFIASRNIKIIEEINDLIFDSHNTIIKAKKKLESIKRNGFIANYMGSNILIESSYLSSDQKSFSGLVNNIKNIVHTLDSQLDRILNDINQGDNMLSALIKLRINN